MRRLQLVIVSFALVPLLTLSACDTISELAGTEDSAVLTQAALAGKVLSFTPDDPIGGIPNWDYVFNSGSVRGCNQEDVYSSTGWEVVDDQTVKVLFGSEWEEYRLVEHRGTLAEGSLHGRFEYNSSPGVAMVGEFMQLQSSNWCP